MCEKRPPLSALTGETLAERTANSSTEARLDISARGFWVPGQKVFCDVRVFDLNAQRYRNVELKRCFQKNEEEKKKKYNERVLRVENASFTPLVFSANGGMGKECKKFYSRLAEMIAENTRYSNVGRFDFCQNENFLLVIAFGIVMHSWLTINKSYARS